MRYLVMIMVAVLSGSVSAQLPPPPTQVTLGWDIPTLTESGEPLAVEDIAGYELLGNCTQEPIEVMGGEQNSLSMDIDASQSCDWQVRAVDVIGQRSDLSNKVTVEFDAPGAPVLRRVSF